MSGILSCSSDDESVLRSYGVLEETHLHDESESVSLSMVEQSLSAEQTSASSNLSQGAL